MHGTLNSVARSEVDTVSVVAEIKRKHRDAGEDDLAHLLAARLRTHQDELEVICRKLVHAALCTLGKIGNAKRSTRPVDVNEEIERLAKRVRIACVLNVVQVNGLKLRYCRGSEIAGFGEAYRRLADAVPPEALCGEVLLEAEVKELLNADGR
jgi:hypothetical protein